MRFLIFNVINQRRVVQRTDNTIQQINRYPTDKCYQNVLPYPPDKDLSSGKRHPTFEQPEPVVRGQP